MHTLLRLTLQGYLALAVLAGVPAGAGRLVLCVAPNGHVEIELGGERCVDTVSPGSDASDPSGPRTLADDCRDCVDVPMGTPVLSEARGRGTDTGHEGSVALSLLPADPAAQTRDAAMHAGSAPATASHAAFPPSRTTILRN